MATAPAVQKILRIGVIQGGKIIEERLVKRRETVTIGQGSKNTIVIPVSNLPPSFAVFELRGATYVLRFTDNMAGRLSSGDTQLDFAALKTQGLVVGDTPVFTRNRLVVIAPADSPLRGEVGIPLARIAEQLFVVREQGSGTRMVFESALKAAGIDPADLQVIMELGTGEAIVSAIEGGMGIGVVSGWAADKAITLGTVVALDVEGFPLERPLYIAAPRGVRSRAAEALVSLTLSGHTRPRPE